MIDLRLALGFMLMAFVFGIWSGISITENDVSVARTEASRMQTEALQRQAVTHNKQVDDLNRINDETIEKLSKITAVSAVTADTGNSLQQQYTASLCKPTSHIKTASTITDSAADATTSLVHSYVFGIVNQRAITYAKIADESRYRGLACEAEYAAVTSAVGF